MNILQSTSKNFEKILDNILRTTTSSQLLHPRIGLPVSAILLLFASTLTPTLVSAANKTPKKVSMGTVLKNEHRCNARLMIRSQALSKNEALSACKALEKTEARFQDYFNRRNAPVKNDFNHQLIVNVYQDRESYVEFAPQHFDDMPVDNGGMYLEGIPSEKDNQAAFITYQKGEVIWNLQHEYVHYLDGRFNIYGDFCAALHDSHSPPENCAKPAPLTPYTIWWSEGLGEYIAKGATHERAQKSVCKNLSKYQLSDLFDTGYEKNGGVDRVYFWGYYAVQFMLENEREKTNRMLAFLRKGDFPRYQALIRSWGQSMDKSFNQWLTKITNC